MEMEYSSWTKQDWCLLLHQIEQKRCILMLGPDTSAEEIHGQYVPLMKQLANRLYPNLDPEIQQHVIPDNLAQVAQHYKRHDLVIATEDFYREKQSIENDLYRELATLPFYITITSTPDKSFYEALKMAQKEPMLEYYNFMDEGEKQIQLQHERDSNFPVVYHLYGIIDEPDSLVLTENDLLKFLTAVIEGHPPILLIFGGNCDVGTGTCFF